MLSCPLGSCLCWIPWPTMPSSNDCSKEALWDLEMFVLVVSLLRNCYNRKVAQLYMLHHCHTLDNWVGCFSVPTSAESLVQPFAGLQVPLNGQWPCGHVSSLYLPIALGESVEVPIVMFKWSSKSAYRTLLIRSTPSRRPLEAH